MGRVALILFISLSCSLLRRESSNPIPPDVKPAIEAISNDSGVKRETKEEVIKTLTSCQQYADQANARFDRLEAEIEGLRAEILSKDLKIKGLEEELSTWKTIKNILWGSLAILIFYFISKFIWSNRLIIGRLLGIPM